MSRAASGYPRVKNDLYETPAWVVDALAEVVALRGRIVWEPACGSGKMVNALRAQGAIVRATDIVDYGSPLQDGLFDFTSADSGAVGPVHAIITNPPYGPRNSTAIAFAERGLGRLPNGGFMALLLPTDIDHGSTRKHLFGECPHFAGQLKLTRRINWFGEGRNDNTQNHSWFIWRRDAIGQRFPSQVWYGPRRAA